MSPEKQPMKSTPSISPISPLRMGPSRPPPRLSGQLYSSVDTGECGSAVGRGTAKRKEKRRPILTSTLQGAPRVQRQQPQVQSLNRSSSFTWEIVQKVHSRAPSQDLLHHSLQGKGPASCVLTRSFYVTKVREPVFGGSLDTFLFALIQECHLLGKLLRCWEVNKNTGEFPFIFLYLNNFTNPKQKATFL